MAKDFKSAYFKTGKAFLDSIVTMDESWILYSTPEMKRMSAQWLTKGSNPPKKAKVVGSEKKLMLIAFFDSKGMIYQTYLPKGHTINSDYYIKVLSTFLKHLRKKRPEKIAQGWLLHQDNARPHVSRATADFMVKKDIKILPHAPYSPDLAPCDFWLFPQLKTKLSGIRFDTEIELRTGVEGALKDLTAGGVLHVFEKWHARLIKCIEVGGGYVEK
jgi:Transposase.